MYQVHTRLSIRLFSEYFFLNPFTIVIELTNVSVLVVYLTSFLTDFLYYNHANNPSKEEFLAYSIFGRYVQHG